MTDSLAVLKQHVDDRSDLTDSSSRPSTLTLTDMKAGYTDYHVNLSMELQDETIKRKEYKSS